MIDKARGNGYDMFPLRNHFGRCAETWAAIALWLKQHRLFDRRVKTTFEAIVLVIRREPSLPLSKSRRSRHMQLKPSP